MGVDQGAPLLLVTGMHRSGTSALCAALQAAGVSFGEQLLDPMAGVNDEGFWEDQRVVAINDRLLQRLGLQWYTVSAATTVPDWSDERFEPERASARELLQQGFGAATVQAIKDPRFCITLGFWLPLCESLGLQTSVCVISRAPLEVAASLQKRDGFPTGLGLRLYHAYHSLLGAQCPPASYSIRYSDLLDDAGNALAALAAKLPLDLVALDGSAAVRSDLRHQHSEVGDSPLHGSATTGDSLLQLAEVVEATFPTGELQSQLLMLLVQRGRELSQLGESHSLALANLEQRDRQIEDNADHLQQSLATITLRDAEITNFDRRLSETGQHLGQALATLAERDQQIVELDGRLQELGLMHSEALDHIATLDAGLVQANERIVQANERIVQTNERLERLFATPGVGRLIRRLWARAES